MDAPPLSLDRAQILEYQLNRPPYLLIDAADAVVPGERACGYMMMAPELFFFPCHFPGDPSVPGLLQVEAIVQMAALSLVTLPGNKGKVCYLTHADKLKFKRKVVPGDRFDIETRVLALKRGVARLEGTGKVKGELACAAEFGLVLPHLLQQFRVPGAQPVSDTSSAVTALPTSRR